MSAGTDAYNMALGERRADAVKAFMVNLGISASRLDTISYGEERPADFGRNEEAWAKNRRAHFAYLLMTFCSVRSDGMDRDTVIFLAGAHAPLTSDATRPSGR
jgi:hypothetical protein